MRKYQYTFHRFLKCPFLSLPFKLMQMYSRIKSGGFKRKCTGKSHLFQGKDVLIEVELDLFVSNVDTQLLK